MIQLERDPNDETVYVNDQTRDAKKGPRCGVKMTISFLHRKVVEWNRAQHSHRHDSWNATLCSRELENKHLA
ncbi:hypothetical protein Mapa_017025 [Marchantia paleacea]|nr:hypothetical protein Mapa_017025 [Marchantia paleacea]